MKKDDPDKTPVDGGHISHWERKFRQNRAARERALRREAGRSVPELMEPDLDELSDRIEALERKTDSKPPGPVRWLWGTLDRLPGWGRVIVVLVVLGVVAWRGAAWAGWVP